MTSQSAVRAGFLIEFLECREMSRSERMHGLVPVHTGFQATPYPRTASVCT
jgi:hypothetical protein